VDTAANGRNEPKVPNAADHTMGSKPQEADIGLYSADQAETSSNGGGSQQLRRSIIRKLAI